MTRKFFTIIITVAIFAITSGVAIANGPIVVDPTTNRGLSESNQVVAIARDGDGTVWAGSTWVGIQDTGAPSVAGPAPFYGWGQQMLSIQYRADAGPVVDLGWSEWQNPRLAGEAYQIQIPAESWSELAVWVEVRQSDCNNYGGEAYAKFVSERTDSSVEIEKGGPPFGTFYVHTSEQVLQTFAFVDEGSLLEPWDNEEDALRKVNTDTTSDWAIGRGDKITLAEGQAFILWGHDMETGAYRLVGIGKVLYGKPGSVEVWPDGNECSVIENIYWCPPGAISR